MRHTKAPWFAIDYAGSFDLQSGPHYGDVNLLSYNEFHDNYVDEETAKANALLASKSPEMLEALKGLYELRSLIYYPEDTRPEHANEALAVHNAMTKIESIIKDLE